MNAFLSSSINPGYSHSRKNIPSKIPPQRIPTSNSITSRFDKMFIKPLDDLISKSLDLPLRPFLDPKHVLSGNFSPVDELPPTKCEITEGFLPSCLDGGAYIRNGPNPQFMPAGPYHLFDGDGMLHVMKISKGEATFCCRYVETYKYVVERQLGYPIFVSPFSSFNGAVASFMRCVLSVARTVAGSFDPLANGFGTANTSVALLGKELFALCESDLPYAIELTSGGDVKTISRHDLHASDPSFSRMTAHPKTDADTGEVFAFRCSLVSPFLVFFKIDRRGRKGRDLPISSVKLPSFVHDFALTKNYIVFEESQVVFDVFSLMRGKLASPLKVDGGKTPRVGILPRRAEDESELMWIDARGLNMLHLVNAWEEDGGDDDAIVIVAPNARLDGVGSLESFDSLHSILEKITIDVKTMRVRSRNPLSMETIEFVAINPRYYGRKTRYVYAAIRASTAKVSGVLKIDTSSDCTVASRSYGPGCYGGEPFFVANGDDEEDDGYLVTYLHDENKQESYFLIMNAKSPTLDIVARVRLPQRVPYGFHGLFVRECDLLSDLTFKI